MFSLASVILCLSTGFLPGRCLPEEGVTDGVGGGGGERGLCLGGYASYWNAHLFIFWFNLHSLTNYIHLQRKEIQNYLMP